MRPLAGVRLPRAARLSPFFRKNIFFLPSSPIPGETPPLSELRENGGKVKIVELSSEKPLVALWTLRRFFSPRKSHYEYQRGFPERFQSYGWAGVIPRNHSIVKAMLEYMNERGNLREEQSLVFVPSVLFADAYIITDVPIDRKQEERSLLERGTRDKMLHDVLVDPQFTEPLVERFIGGGRGLKYPDPLLRKAEEARENYSRENEETNRILRDRYLKLKSEEVGALMKERSERTHALLEKEKRLRREWALSRINLGRSNFSELRLFEKKIIAQFTIGAAATNRFVSEFDKCRAKFGEPI